ncbi:MAG TPA: hypothetical protein VJU81_10490 [Methylomirabilota bacterium]|nr:hypothetical protein [Methylomirabilota bacterium]
MTITRWKCVALALVVMLAGPYATWLSAAEAQTRQSATEGSILTSNTIESHAPTKGDAVGAALMNVVYVPGKAIVCTLGTVGTVGLLLVTFGFAYQAAANVFREGCGGDWVLTPEHVSGAIPSPTYDYLD